MNNEIRECQNCKNQFVIEPDDFSFYETIHVPAPTWCPKCRMIRRLAWWGYRILYKRKCDFTGDDMITFYHPDLPYKVYKQEVWHSDKWDPKDYGRAYDFKRPFFEQFRELFDAVPKPALHTEYSTMTNSEYCNAAAELKNCYLCFKADRSENCAYLKTISYIKDSFDLSYANYVELSYESVNINKCYQIFYSHDCDECHDVWFSQDLVGCSNCIGCINLKNKNYHIFNEPYSKDEYEKKLKEFDFGSRKNVEEFKKKFKAFALQYPRRQFHGRRNQNVSGDYIYHAKNVLDSYWIDTAEDVRYSQLLQALNSAKCYDHSGFGLNAEWVYDSCWVGINTSNVKFCFWNYSGHDVEYCTGCHGSGNCFGCVGLRNAEYCILNKQYSKEEYIKTVEAIKKQMAEIPYIDTKGRTYRYGEFFPSEFTPWRYNETTAYEFFPLTKEETLSKGFSWRDHDAREYKPSSILLSDHIKDVTDEILKGILQCESCGKNYQIIQKELAFYRRFSLPIPRECPLCRDYARAKLLNPIEIYDRACAKCGVSIKTSYAPERPEIVYCEQCYQAEVI